ncbi:MAG: alpha/beta fold hydrolase [Actinomycetota bacterium]
METSPVKYAKTSSGYVGYKTYGDGALDLLLIHDYVGCIDVLMELPSSATLIRRLASIGRLTVFDKRGHGISDPLPRRSPVIESAVEDCVAVLEAVGAKRAVIIAAGFAGSVGMALAATYPERTRSLILINAFARFLRDENYPCGLPMEMVSPFIGIFERLWGTGEALHGVAMSMAQDEASREWYARMQRLSQGPSEASAGFGTFVLRMDVRGALSAISVPALILHREHCQFARVEHAHYLAEHIAGSKLALLSGDSFILYIGNTEEIASEIEEFVAGARELERTDRVLATVMFSDIVDSTATAAKMGDLAWRSLLDRHDAIVARAIGHYRGRLIKTTGDGVLATFEAPGRAIACARSIQQELRACDLRVRTGIHTGEVELRGEDVGGLGVHIAARVAAVAEAEEILISQTVADLIVGSEIEVADRGSRELKGVPGAWRLLAIRD